MVEAPDEMTILVNLVNEMTLNEYQRTSMRTAGDSSDPAWELSGYGLGIAGEAGEVADLIKKVNHHGHPLDRDQLKKELGDVLWYVQGIAARTGFTLQDIAQTNINKLKARYPQGWDPERSLNRTKDE